MPTPFPTTAVQSTSLYYRVGSFDNEYHTAIEPAAGGGYTVTFANGRHHATLNTGTKTPAPVSLARATKVFERLVAAKLAKGYRLSCIPVAVYHPNDRKSTYTGIRPQLLNPVEECELPRLLDDHRHCLQQKHDGRRIMVRQSDSGITGITRRGLAVALPGPIYAAVAAIGLDLLIDGEAVGDTLHAFDLLEIAGADLRQRGYLDRYRGLAALLGDGLPGISAVPTSVDPASKRAMFANCRDTGCEGVVFKDIGAPFTAGRPASGGPQLQHRFVRSFANSHPNPF